MLKVRIADQGPAGIALLFSESDDLRRKTFSSGSMGTVYNQEGHPLLSFTSAGVRLDGLEKSAQRLLEYRCKQKFLFTCRRSSAII